MIITHNIIQLYLQSKNLTGKKQIDYILADDLNGVYIHYWNKEILGTRPTEQDLQPFIFIEAQQQVINIVNSIYHNNDTWFFTIQDATSSLTKMQDWFLIKLSTEPIFFDSKNRPQSKVLTIEQVSVLKNKINKIGFSITVLQQNLIKEITNTKTQEAISKYTTEYIQAEFDKINKTIIIN